MIKLSREQIPKNIIDLESELQCNIQCFTINKSFAFLILPRDYKPASETPWLWYAITLRDKHPKATMSHIFGNMLSKGIAVAGIDVGESYGNPMGVVSFTVMYNELTTNYNLSRNRIVLLPQSRGGLMLYNWASRNAEKINGIAGLYTVCDMRSYPGLGTAAIAYGMNREELERKLSQYNPIDLLQPLVDNEVPIFHIHGDSDKVVPLEANSGELCKRYKELGGYMILKIVPEGDHSESDDFFKSSELVDFILQALG